jgi:hypothetical protein
MSTRLLLSAQHGAHARHITERGSRHVDDEQRHAGMNTPEQTLADLVGVGYVDFIWQWRDHRAGAADLRPGRHKAGVVLPQSLRRVDNHS